MVLFVESSKIVAIELYFVVHSCSYQIGQDFHGTFIPGLHLRVTRYEGQSSFLLIPGTICRYVDGFSDHGTNHYIMARIVTPEKEKLQNRASLKTFPTHCGQWAIFWHKSIQMNSPSIHELPSGSQANHGFCQGEPFGLHVRDSWELPGTPESAALGRGHKPTNQLTELRRCRCSVQTQGRPLHLSQTDICSTSNQFQHCLGIGVVGGCGEVLGDPKGRMSQAAFGLAAFLEANTKRERFHIDGLTNNYINNPLRSMIPPPSKCCLMESHKQYRIV